MLFILKIILLGGWGAMTYFLPTMLYGCSYEDIVTLIGDKDLDKLTTVTKALGITTETASQTGLKYLFTCIGISVGVLLGIILITKIIKRLSKK